MGGRRLHRRSDPSKLKGDGSFLRLSTNLMIFSFIMFIWLIILSVLHISYKQHILKKDLA